MQTTVLHMKRLNQTESPIFVILYVLCFQRQSFFYFYCNFFIENINTGEKILIYVGVGYCRRTNFFYCQQTEGLRFVIVALPGLFSYLFFTESCLWTISNSSVSLYTSMLPNSVSFLISSSCLIGLFLVNHRLQ